LEQHQAYDLEGCAGIAIETAQVQSFFPEPLGTALGKKMPEMGWKRALSKSEQSCNQGLSA